MATIPAAEKWAWEKPGLLAELKANPSNAVQFKAVKNALGKMEINLRHPSLQTHKFL